MKYMVEGGTAEFGTDLVLTMSDEQYAARAHKLEKVEGGYRPTRTVQFKVGEEVGVNCAPDKLPRPLAIVLAPLGAKKTAAKLRADRRRRSSKKATAGKSAPAA